MNREINSIFAIGFLLFLSTIVGGVVWYYGSQGIDSAQEIKITIQIRDRSLNQEIEKWRTYENKDHDFSLVLPKGWQGYEVKKRTFNWGTIGKSESLDFGFPKENRIIFNIVFVSKKQLKQLTKSGEPVGTFLGENSDTVFLLNQEKYSKDEKMEKFLSEIPEIIKSFKIEK